MGPEKAERVLSLGASQLDTLGTVFNSVASILLGFCFYGRLTTLKIDYIFFKELFEFRRVIAILTRTVYFASRYVCIGYLISQVVIIDGRQRVNCTAISLFIVASFYFLLLCNHWLFTSRLLAVWHGHPRQRLIQAYVAVGYGGLLTTVILNFSDSQYGVEVPAVGCLYVVNWQTYPKKSYQIALCVLGLLYHTINMVLAIMRLASFRHANDDHILDGFSLRTFGDALLSVFAVFGKSTQKAQQRRNLAQDLIEQGFHYWAARTILVSTLVFLPSFAFERSTLAATVGFAVFTVADVELSGLLYRATVSASRRPSLGGISTLKSNRFGQNSAAARVMAAGPIVSTTSNFSAFVQARHWTTMSPTANYDESSGSHPRKSLVTRKTVVRDGNGIDLEQGSDSPPTNARQTDPPSPRTLAPL